MSNDYPRKKRLNVINKAYQTQNLIDANISDLDDDIFKLEQKLREEKIILSNMIKQRKKLMHERRGIMNFRVDKKKFKCMFE